MKSRFFPPQTGQSSTIGVAVFAGFPGPPAGFPPVCARAATSSVSTHRPAFMDFTFRWTQIATKCSALWDRDGKFPRAGRSEEGGLQLNPRFLRDLRVVLLLGDTIVSIAQQSRGQKPARLQSLY
jgi:hypothetical protein